MMIPSHPLAIRFGCQRHCPLVCRQQNPYVPLASVKLAYRKLTRRHAAVAAKPEILAHLSNLLEAGFDSLCEIDHVPAVFYRVVSNPLLSLGVAVLLVVTIPRLVKFLIRLVARPVLVMLTVCIVVTQPTKLFEFLLSIQSFMVVQPTACSILILITAALLLAPHLLTGMGAAAATYALMAVVLRRPV